jgi:outer membrane lipoprotein SlyB
VTSAVHCLGSTEKPTAPKGELCIYSAEEASNIALGTLFSPPIHKIQANEHNPGASETGAVLGFSASEDGSRASGTFAVTAE